MVNEMVMGVPRTWWVMIWVSWVSSVLIPGQSFGQSASRRAHTEEERSVLAVMSDFLGNLVDGKGGG